MFAWSRTFELRQFFFFTYVWTILPCHSTNEQPQVTSTCCTVPPPSQYLPGHLNISQWPPRCVKDHKEGPNSGIYRHLGTRYIFFSLMSLFSISFQFFFTIDTMLLPTTVIWRQQWPATCMATEKQRCPRRHVTTDTSTRRRQSPLNCSTSNVGLEWATGMQGDSRRAEKGQQGLKTPLKPSTCVFFL